MNRWKQSIPGEFEILVDRFGEMRVWWWAGDGWKSTVSFIPDTWQVICAGD